MENNSPQTEGAPKPRRFQLSLAELLWLSLWVSGGSYFVFMNTGGGVDISGFHGSSEHAEYLFEQRGGYRFLAGYLLSVPVGLLLAGWLIFPHVYQTWSRLALLVLISVIPPGITMCFIPNYRNSGGHNESSAIMACKIFASAEDTYRRVDYDGDGVLEYSPSLAGLYSSGQINMIDKSFAFAEGTYGIPKQGYVFKVLTMQGAGAPGGSKYYMKDGKMTEGYALIAKPKVWGQWAWNSYQISRDGTVYEKDLGKDTDKIFNAMNAFDPTGWYTSE